ncbi:MAG: bifunctional phosphoglucose/phosphomannose isomerase [Candidatus Cloacimonadota bacterium]|nr:MAG: bifunctional phosphoglucose/phosphomannose isomerase [Candidatus Cloacimonadota bacterium]
MISLDDHSIISKSDKEDMYHKIIHTPEQLHFAYFETDLIKPEPFFKYDKSLIKRVIICGMGGSAVSADLAKAAFNKKIPVEVVKDYRLPYCDESALVIAMSYSGNTEETLTCFKEALGCGGYFGAVTSGGKLGELIKDKFISYPLPPNLPPRSAVAYLFWGLIKIMEAFEVIESQEEVAKPVLAHLITKAGAICMAQEERSNLAKMFARQINGKIPIIYSNNPDLYPAAYRMKCQINENSKYPAFCHTFSEMNHNEIEAWECGKFDNFIPVFITRMSDDGQYSKRLKAFRSLLEKNNTETLDLYTEGKSVIEENFSVIYLADMISFYLGILNEQNPTSIEYINFLKKQL